MSGQGRAGMGWFGLGLEKRKGKWRDRRPEQILREICIGVDAKLHAIGHRGRGDWSGSSGGSASALMPTYKEWVIKGEASGADPRGICDDVDAKVHSMDQRKRIIRSRSSGGFGKTTNNRSARTAGTRKATNNRISEGICFKKLSPQMSKHQPDRTTSDSTGVCPNFQHI